MISFAESTPVKPKPTLKPKKFAKKEADRSDDVLHRAEIIQRGIELEANNDEIDIQECTFLE